MLNFCDKAVGAKDTEAARDGSRYSLLILWGCAPVGKEQPGYVAVAETSDKKFAAADSLKQAQFVRFPETKGSISSALVSDGATEVFGQLRKRLIV
jgi:hypothetical protein